MEVGDTREDNAHGCVGATALARLPACSTPSRSGAMVNECVVIPAIMPKHEAVGKPYRDGRQAGGPAAAVVQGPMRAHSVACICVTSPATHSRKRTTLGSDALRGATTQ